MKYLAIIAALILVSGCKNVLSIRRVVLPSSSTSVPTPTPDCDTTASPFGGGSGVLADPYKICTAQHLQNIDSAPAYQSKAYILKSNIDLSAFAFTSINSFSGNLNGNGKTIQGLNSTGPLIQSLTGVWRFMT